MRNSQTKNPTEFWLAKVINLCYKKMVALKNIFQPNSWFMPTVEERLEIIIAQILDIKAERLRSHKQSNFFKELGVDSLLGLELVAAAEREFDIKIEDEEIPGLGTFNDLLNLVNQKLTAQH